jgi:hypothetical protein
MAIYTVFKTNKREGDKDHRMIVINGRKYFVFRSSPLFGDVGFGAVKVNNKTYTVYRAKQEDGDIGYGVVDIQSESVKKQTTDDSKDIPDGLAEIIRLWPRLPEDIKSKIELLVHSNCTKTI